MKQFVSLLIALALTSCAAAESTANELHSDVLSALSLTSETELFVQQIEGGHMLTNFQTAHAGYLRGEAEREAKEARASEKKSQDTVGFDSCAKQLESLSGELRLIGTHRDPKTLDEIRRRVAAIREALLVASSSQ